MERNRADRVSRTPSGAAVPSAQLTHALYRAFFRDWAEHGFSAISLERVASRAGAGKAAIYRRWATKLQLAEEAVVALGVGLVVVEDRGTLEDDLLAFLLRLRAVLRHPLVRRILPDIHAEAIRSPKMAAISRRVAETRRVQALALIEKAVERGELAASLDRSLALDQLPAALYWRMIIIQKPIGRTELSLQAKAITSALQALR